MRIAASALRDLKNERRLGIDAAPKKAKDLLQIVDVIPAKRILGVSKSIKSSSSDNHSSEYRRDLRQSARGVFIGSTRRPEKSRGQELEHSRTPGYLIALGIVH